MTAQSQRQALFTKTRPYIIHLRLVNPKEQRKTMGPFSLQSYPVQLLLTVFVFHQRSVSCLQMSTSRALFHTKLQRGAWWICNCLSASLGLLARTGNSAQARWKRFLFHFPLQELRRLQGCGGSCSLLPGTETESFTSLDFLLDTPGWAAFLNAFGSSRAMLP